MIGLGPTKLKDQRNPLSDELRMEPTKMTFKYDQEALLATGCLSDGVRTISYFCSCLCKPYSSIFVMGVEGSGFRLKPTISLI